MDSRVPDVLGKYSSVHERAFRNFWSVQIDIVHFSSLLSAESHATLETPARFAAVSIVIQRLVRTVWSHPLSELVASSMPLQAF